MSMLQKFAQILCDITDILGGPDSTIDTTDIAPAVQKLKDDRDFWKRAFEKKLASHISSSESFQRRLSDIAKKVADAIDTLKR